MTPPTPSEALAEELDGMRPRKVDVDFDNLVEYRATVIDDLLERAVTALRASPPSVCPNIVTSDEGTSYCRLAEQPKRMRPYREELIDRIFAAYGITDYPMNRKMLRELLDRAAASSGEKGGGA